MIKSALANHPVGVVGKKRRYWDSYSQGNARNKFVIRGGFE